MNKLLIVLLVFFGTSFASHSQKWGYIDSDYILSKVPEYEDAKKKLDKFAEKWQKEIEDRYAALQKKKDEYARVEAILPDEEREKRKEEIDVLETETMEYQKMRFGVNGDLFQKRKELIQPIQDKVYDAMAKVASKGNYGFIFDKANQSNLVYADNNKDISSRVLREMGISDN